jgi:hypothetical protein
MRFFVEKWNHYDRSRYNYARLQYATNCTLNISYKKPTVSQMKTAAWLAAFHNKQNELVILHERSNTTRYFVMRHINDHFDVLKKNILIDFIFKVCWVETYLKDRFHFWRHRSMNRSFSSALFASVCSE